MAERKKKLKKLKFTAEQALNIICSDDYTFGTSSSDNSSSQSSYSDDSSDTNLPSPSQEVKKEKKLLPKRVQNDMLDKHGKIAGVSQTHVQPTFNLPIALEAAKKLDTPPTLGHNHDNCQVENSPDTVHTDTTPQELVVSIPIDFEVQNEDTDMECNDFSFLNLQTLNQTPEEIPFPPEYFTNEQNDQTSSDNETETEQNDYIIQTETNETHVPVQYPTSNYEKDIELQEDIDNGWVRVDNDQLPNHCHFIGNEGLNMNTTSCNPEDFFNNLFDDRMYTIIAEETNKYARHQIMKVMGNRDPFQHMDHYSYRKHARLHTWKDLNSSDIKIFIAHLLVMSSI